VQNPGHAAVKLDLLRLLGPRMCGRLGAADGLVKGDLVTTVAAQMGHECLNARVMKTPR
jgi:hypothetical protein